MSFYPNILDIFNSRSDADDGAGFAGDQLADEMESDRPFGMKDMQEWSDSLAIAAGVLGAAYEDGGMLAQQAGHYMRDEEPAAAPPPPAFDPDECTILRAPMTVRRGSISLTARKAGFFF